MSQKSYLEWEPYPIPSLGQDNLIITHGKIFLSFSKKMYLNLRTQNVSNLRALKFSFKSYSSVINNH